MILQPAREDRAKTRFRLAMPLLLLLATALPAHAEDLSPAEMDKIQKIVRDYIREHPEIIVDALQAYQRRQDAQKAEQTRQTIAALKDELLNDPTSPVAGNPKGDVTVVEFFDYRCPYCKAVAPDLAKAVAVDGKVRLIYKEFPILGPASITAAKAALAAVRQDKYLALHDKLFGFKGNLDDAAIYAMASELGLDVARLKADMEKPEIQKTIDRSSELADKLKIDGTPAFVIGNELIPGAASFDDLIAAFKRARRG
jgi:protein-disulfide isomerase